MSLLTFGEMAHVVEWDFDARDAQAARRARTELVEYVRRECRDADPSSAELVLGELIGNVARYVPGPAHIEAKVDDTQLTIEVHDKGSGFAPPAVAQTPADPFSDRGRGLMIVQTLSDEFEVNCHSDHGCRVRARLTVRGGL